MRTSSTQWVVIRQNNLITFNNNALKKALYMGIIFLLMLPSFKKHACPTCSWQHVARDMCGLPAETFEMKKNEFQPLPWQHHYEIHYCDYLLVL